jgi:hypothetical protein
MDVEVVTVAAQFLLWEYVYVSNFRYWFFAVNNVPYRETVVINR